MKDLSPWLEYFDMIQDFVKKGFIEMIPAANETYITSPALYTLTDADIVKDLQSIEKMESPSRRQRFLAGKFKALCGTARRIWVYSEYLNTHAKALKQYRRMSDEAPVTPATSTAVRQADENMRKPRKNRQRTADGNAFALHVVSDKYPHGLLYTILAVRRRRWWWPWRKTERYEVIGYK